jgi:hypothetical protein
MVRAQTRSAQLAFKRSEVQAMAKAIIVDCKGDSYAKWGNTTYLVAHVHCARHGSLLYAMRTLLSTSDDGHGKIPWNSRSALFPRGPGEPHGILKASAVRRQVHGTRLLGLSASLRSPPPRLSGPPRLHVLQTGLVSTVIHVYLFSSDPPSQLSLRWRPFPQRGLRRSGCCRGFLRRA